MNVCKGITKEHIMKKSSPCKISPHLLLDDKEKEFIANAMANVMSHKAKQTQTSKINTSNIVIDHATLSYCLNVLAHLINDGEDVYLPIFKRIKLELDKLEQDNELKDLAKTIVAQNVLNTQFNNQALH